MGAFANRAKAELTFTDAGEPGRNDFAKIVIKVGTSTVLSVSGNSDNGNQQAHAQLKSSGR